MLKRKVSRDSSSGPRPSVYDDDPTRMTFKRKRLFRPKNNNNRGWTPKAERVMSELLEFVLQHEEAFKK